MPTVAGLVSAIGPYGGWLRPPGKQKFAEETRMLSI
jgi:hypothetical protein